MVPGIRFSFGLRFRGLGLHSLSCHAAATFIASLSSSGLDQAGNHHRQQAVTSKVSLHHTIMALTFPTPQRELSSKIDENVFKSLFGTSSTVDKARLLLSPYAASWLSVAPFMSLGFHLESNEFQTGSEVVVRHGNFW